MSDDIGGAEDDSEEDPEFSPDLGFSSVAKPLSYQHPHAHVKTEIGDACFGVPYGDEDDEDDEDEDEGDSDALSDEIRFSHERYFSPRLHELLRGSVKGGDPASHTGLLTGVRPMLLHQSDSPHPERPARLVAIYNELIERGLDARSRLVPAREASTADLELVHTPEQVAKSTGLYPSDGAASATLGLDSDTYFAASASGYAARLAAGSVVELVTRVVHGELRNALAVVRPPGHHCEATQAMGFCLLNNVCVAVAVARRRLGVPRVLVVDWDVHHGNGVQVRRWGPLMTSLIIIMTSLNASLNASLRVALLTASRLQNIFRDDPTVLYVSLHRCTRIARGVHADCRMIAR